MNLEDIESAIAPLTSSWAPREGRWPARMLRSRAAYEAFTALENELFIDADGAYSAPLLVASATRGEFA